MALLFALFLPALTFANSWTLPSGPTTTSSYSFQWKGTVRQANAVVMMEVQAPGSTVWQTCGAGYPDSNCQATVTGSKSFGVNGIWSVRVIQYITSTNLAVASSTTFRVGPIVDFQDPTPPSALKASSIADTSFNLSWDPSTDDNGIARYEVYCDDNKIATVTSPTATITGCAPNTTYTMSVVAFDIVGKDSVLSPDLTVTTLKTPPVVLGWSLPSSVSAGTYARVKWVGSSTSNTILLWCQQPGTNAWFNIGGNSSTTDPKTVTGGWSFNTTGVWTIVVRNGTTPISPILSQTSLYVR